MIESPLIKEIIAEVKQDGIQTVLTARFGQVPDEVGAALRALEDLKRLDDLIDLAVTCPDLASFQALLRV